MGTLAYTALMVVWFSVAAYLAEIVAELGLTSTQAGLLTGAIPLTYVPVALFSGVVTDRIGPYRAIGIGLVLFGAAQVGRAGADSFAVLLGLTVVVGVGGTAITFGLPKLVAELFPTDASGTPSSIYMLGSFVGTASAFSIGRGVVGPVLGGWRPLFTAIGVAVLAYAVLWWVVVYLAPISTLREPIDGTADAPDTAGSADTDDTADTDEPTSTDGGVRGIAALRRDVGRVFRRPAMRWLVVVGVVYLLIVHGLQNWLATVLQARGVAPTLAANVTGAFVAAEAVGTLTVPAVSDRLGRRGGVIAACGAACALGTAALLVPGVPFALPVAGALVVGVGVGGISPLVRMVPPEIEGVGPALTGTAVGLVFAVGELGGFLGPFLVGALFDLTGSYAPGLAVIGLACLGAVVAGRRIPA
jgi:cyanate permease